MAFLDDAGLATLWELVKAQDSNVIAHADTKAKIAVGSYTGTDTYGSSNPNSLTFSFAPKLILLFVNNGSYWYGFDSGEGDSSITPYKYYILCDKLTTSYQNTGFPGYSHDRDANLAHAYAKKSSDGKTISWYNAGTNSYTQVAQLNRSGYQYYYIAIG